MRIKLLDTGSLTTEGREMFCGLKEVSWQEYYPVENNGRAKWAIRSLLIVHGDQRILIDTGLGTKMDRATCKQYEINDDYLLPKILLKNGIRTEEITHVILTHLHFDHCGGNTHIDENGQVIPTFNKAKYYCSKTQLNYALNPEPGDAESYRQDDFLPLMNSGILHFIEDSVNDFPFMEFRKVNGHTPGQIIPIIKLENDFFAFAADLLPSAAHIPDDHIMAYDMNPALSRQEKLEFIQESVDRKYTILLQHDFRYQHGKLREVKRFVNS